MTWVPLHCHSQYSILDASASIPDIIQKCKASSIQACALTDHGNMYGVVEFYKEAKKHNIKPLLGCELYLAPESRHTKKRIPGLPKAYHQTLIAKNEEGYSNLIYLSSMGFSEGFYYVPRADKELLEKHSKGLICLSGCLSSLLSKAIGNNEEEKIEPLIEWYLKLFGEDFYIELQRQKMTSQMMAEDGMEEESWLIQKHDEMIALQNRVNNRLIEISNKHSIPLVATNDSHYINRSDWKAHEILLNVQSGETCEIWEKDHNGNLLFRRPNPKRRVYPSHCCHYATPEEMAERFQDLPEAISNTLDVANKCNVEIDFKTKHYPVFVPPSLQNQHYTQEERQDQTAQYLRKLCLDGIPKRYSQDRLDVLAEKFKTDTPLDLVHKRLDHELEIIITKGMCDYLLIVWDFIHWAKGQNIPVGPGRGSGAGSIILYLIGITDIEPLRFDLFFERFINPERLSYPDIDVDICMDRRSEVIQYTIEHYGNRNVCQIITFGKMKAKMSVKDVGRVLNIPLSKVNQIAKLIPDDLNITLEKALEVDIDLKNSYENDEDCQRIINIGLKLEGSIRSTGIHAAGVIISGDALTNFIPTCVAKDSSMPVSQFSMKPVEAVGMLKMDFLGLKTLTSIQTCCNLIYERYGKRIPWDDLPLNDKKTFELLNKGKTLGVFQMESGGFQDLARQLHLDRFEEIIAVLALYRPGPMDMIPSFINRKHGREAIEYDHEWLEDILNETYGIMVYQEQVMQIAQKLAGYMLGEGDVLRRAMGKKDAEEMARQRKKFLAGAIEKGISEEVASTIFDKMEKFASYGFNKSHATAYGYVTYVTAYLKANYPDDWMAALMTCDKDDNTKVTKLINETKNMGIAILPPDVNISLSTFLANDQGIRFALSAIKGVGEGVVAHIVEERKNNGPYKNFHDFIKRINTKKVGKKMIENLIDAGCFDWTKWSRDCLIQQLPLVFDHVAKEQKEEASGVMTFFSQLHDNEENLFKPTNTNLSLRTSTQLLLREKELLGFFVTGHPMETYKNQLQQLGCVSFADSAQASPPSVFRTAFFVESIQVRFSARTQKKFAIMTISDGTDKIELMIWSDLLEKKKMVLEENRLLLGVLVRDEREGQTRYSCRWVDDLTTLNEATIQECDLVFDQSKNYIKQAAERTNRPKKNQPEKKVEKKQEEKITAYTLEYDLTKLSLSQILKIKALLQANSGKSPLDFAFYHESKQLAQLHLGPQFQIHWNEDLNSEMKKINPHFKLEKKC